MIFDVVKKSLASPRVLVSVQEMLGNASGGRMPDVQSHRLTKAIAEHVVSVCPTAALTLDNSRPNPHFVFDYGECIGCGRCFDGSQGALVPAEKLLCCGASKKGLVRRWDLLTGNEIPSDEPALDQLSERIRATVGRALNIRQLDAGSCNGCETEIVALNNPYYDLERFGIHFVASPKHADMLLVTGPVTRNMAEAVKMTYAATPSPKLVLAVGACGISGGIFAGNYAVVGGVDSVIPVDGYVPGCPPTPAMLLTGILHVLRRREQSRSGS
jgi:Ni,Fe-hydrogenase III small subunit/NAD-dependent dihydropyrimidine dehydrogenase PreA subunit